MTLRYNYLRLRCCVDARAPVYFLCGKRWMKLQISWHERVIKANSVWRKKNKMDERWMKVSRFSCSYWGPRGSRCMLTHCFMMCTCCTVRPWTVCGGGRSFGALASGGRLKELHNDWNWLQGDTESSAFYSWFIILSSLLDSFFVKNDFFWSYSFIASITVYFFITFSGFNNRLVFVVLSTLRFCFQMKSVFI